MLWSFPPGAPPPPRLSPLSVRTHARRFLLVFPVFSFRLLPNRPLLSSTFPSFPLSFLRRKASLSVFTADLDLNVHTIKARGECQEWGWLSTRRSARALRGRSHRAQSSSAELRAAASGAGGGDGGGGRGLAPAGLPEPKPLGWGGVWLVTDRGLEMQTNSEKRADSVTETQICASTDGGGGML